MSKLNTFLNVKFCLLKHWKRASGTAHSRLIGSQGQGKTKVKVNMFTSVL